MDRVVELHPHRPLNTVVMREHRAVQQDHAEFSEILSVSIESVFIKTEVLNLRYVRGPISKKLCAVFKIFFHNFECVNSNSMKLILVPAPMRTRSPSPPPPPIAAPLLEMGFSIKHIKKALSSTGNAKYF